MWESEKLEAVLEPVDGVLGSEEPASLDSPEVTEAVEETAVTMEVADGAESTEVLEKPDELEEPVAPEAPEVPDELEEPVAPEAPEAPEALEVPVAHEVESEFASEIETTPAAAEWLEQQLPQQLSETMGEVLLSSAMLALEDQSDDEATAALKLICQRSKLPEHQAMAYAELKRIMPENGELQPLIDLGEALLAQEAMQASGYGGMIEAHTHYLKRLMSLLHAHDIPVDSPYSELPEELKKMALAYQEKIQNRSEA